MSHSRRGFTLVEILVALVIFGLVAATITRILITGQKVTTAQTIRATMQSNLRVGSLVVPNELRMLNQSDSTDILEITDTSIVYRAMRGYYTLCGISSATSITAIRVAGSAFTFDYRSPATGDWQFIFFENDTLKMSDDKWIRDSITAVAASTCTWGGVANRTAVTLTLAAPGLTANGATLAGYVLGAPIRTYEITRMTLYDNGSQKWLGMCTGSASCVPQPVLGPLSSANGLKFTAYDTAGAVITTTSNPTFAARNSLRSIQIRFIGTGEQNISHGSDISALTGIQDTLTTTVTLRNVKQN